MVKRIKTLVEWHITIQIKLSFCNGNYTINEFSFTHTNKIWEIFSWTKTIYVLNTTTAAKKQVFFSFPKKVIRKLFDFLENTSKLSDYLKLHFVPSGMILLWKFFANFFYHFTTI